MSIIEITMSNLASLTSAQLKRAAELKDKIEALSSQLNSLLGGSAPAVAKGTRKGKMSAAGRAKVAAAQRARWAKIKAAKGSSGTKPKAKKKFTMSAAAKAKIGAAAKARWAKIKASKNA
jgi:hypothetical protein